MLEKIIKKLETESFFNILNNLSQQAADLFITDAQKYEKKRLESVFTSLNARLTNKIELDKFKPTEMMPPTQKELDELTALLVKKFEDENGPEDSQKKKEYLEKSLGDLHDFLKIYLKNKLENDEIEFDIQSLKIGILQAMKKSSDLVVSVLVPKSMLNESWVKLGMESDDVPKAEKEPEEKTVLHEPSRPKQKFVLSSNILEKLKKDRKLLVMWEYLESKKKVSRAQLIKDYPTRLGQEVDDRSVDRILDRLIKLTGDAIIIDRGKEKVIILRSVL
jgi:hypothetical protein